MEIMKDKCKKCGGKCCVGIIEVYSSDEIYCADDLTIPSQDSNYRCMRTNDNNQCICLVDGKCAIYSKRPQICKKFRVNSTCCNSFINGKKKIHVCDPCVLYKNSSGNVKEINDGKRKKIIRKI